MKKINKKYSKKGFSLIELMVAVVILSLVIFGIFHAYSVGFMGMADARDRTVATNYLQQAIENFKNMDFDEVKSTPITAIPGTKFSSGTYILNLEEEGGIVSLKKVVSQVRWLDRNGNIKTEKASTIIYNKPATSDTGEEATELLLYAQSYYTILPEHEVTLIAEIKDENGNIYDWDGPVTFSIITDPANDPTVGSITTSQPSQAIHGVAHCIFTAIEGENVEGTERIQATATVDGNILSDTVNIRVTTGPVGIVIAPATEGDRILEAGTGVISNISLTVVKADYTTLVEYDSTINLSAVGPGTLSTTSISSIPTEGTSFQLNSNGSSGIVEIIASAPDLDMGYTEIIFTGIPASIIVDPEKNTIYPGEEIDITVTIVDDNNYPVNYTGNVNLSANPDSGSFGDVTLSFSDLSSMETTFTADIDATVGEKVTLQAVSGSLSGSAEITVLSSLTPTYLDIFVFPSSVDLNGGETSISITAEVYDQNGSEIVTTYNTPITFYSKIGATDFGIFSSNPVTPTDGEAVVMLSSSSPGTTTITASSGDLTMRPEEGIKAVFYESAHHIELSADPLAIQADGHETSIITATVCDEGGNRVENYGVNGDKSLTLTTSLGGFPDNDDASTISSSFFDRGQLSFALSSSVTGTAEVTAVSNDGLSDNGSAMIEFTGDIASELALEDVTNLDDYEIHFSITVTGSSIYLAKMKIEWDNSKGELDEILIRSPFGEEPPLSIITTDGAESPCTENISPVKELVVDELSDIGLVFSGAKMKDNNITVTFTDENDVDYSVSFKVPK